MFRDYRVAYARKNVAIKEAKPLTFLRQSVSYMLSHSARNIPHAAGITHFDVTPLVEYGKESTSKKAEDLDDKALYRRSLHRNFSAFFLKAIAHGLRHTPSLNGFLEYSLYRNGGTLYQAEDINLSFTVHTNWGVVRPIVRNAHLKTIEDVSNEMRTLARKARRTDPDELYFKAARTYAGYALRELDLRAVPGLWMWMRSLFFPRSKAAPDLAEVAEDEKLQVEDILGATCTLANIGMMVTGHQTVTVIIPPEVLMFGIGDLHLAPMVVNGEVVPRWVVTFCMTMDHRAFDAGEAFPLYRYLKSYINEPSLLYDWKPGDEI